MLKEIVRRCTPVYVFISGIVASFLNYEEGDDAQTRGKKVAKLIARRVAYLIADYWLAVLCGAMVAAMMVYHCSFLEIFIAVWIFDILCAGGFTVFYLKTGQDLSLGEDMRRAINAIHRTSRIAAYLSSALLIIWAAVWNGPEKVVAFWRKEVPSVHGMTLIIVLFSAPQALFWAAFYALSYDLVAFGWSTVRSFVLSAF